MNDEDEVARMAWHGRDRSWTDLCVISGAQWSPDEELSLMFGEGGAGDGASSSYLSLLRGRTI